MNKKSDFVPKSLENSISEAAVEALESGKGTNCVGGDSNISVNNSYTILRIDYRTNWFKPEGSDLETSEINAMSDEQKIEAGCQKREWFTFVTTNGDLSFSAVLGDMRMANPEFWDDTAIKAEGFDLTKVFVPSCRVPCEWIKMGCDGIVGKTLRCVATKEFKRGNFDAKARAFVIED